jgi:nicotinamidase-related amidase
VLIDVDTQRDFFLADGSACIRNHRRILANIRRLMAWARTSGIHIVSTAQINKPNGKPGYCVEGSAGLKKLRYTLVSRRRTFDADGYTDLPREIFKEHDQIVLYKRSPDPFEEPRAERVLTELRGDEFVVFGGLIESAIKATVLGLMLRGKKVLLVEDAIGCHDKEAADIAMRQMQAKGARLIETKVLAGVSHLQRVGACECARCHGAIEKEHGKVESPVPAN